MAFEAQGLAWRWDVGRYGELLTVTGVLSDPRFRGKSVFGNMLMEWCIDLESGDDDIEAPCSRKR